MDAVKIPADASILGTSGGSKHVAHFMGVCLTGMCLMGLYLMGVHLMGAYLMGVHPMCVYLTGVHLMGVHLTGMYLIDVYLMSVHLTGVCLMGVRLIGMHLIVVYLMGKKLRAATPESVLEEEEEKVQVPATPEQEEAEGNKGLSLGPNESGIKFSSS